MAKEHGPRGIRNVPRLHRGPSLTAAPSVSSLRRREIFSTDGIIGGLDVKGFFPAIASKQSDAIANRSQVERLSIFYLSIRRVVWALHHTIFRARTRSASNRERLGFRRQCCVVSRLIRPRSMTIRPKRGKKFRPAGIFSHSVHRFYSSRNAQSLGRWHRSGFSFIGE